MNFRRSSRLDKLPPYIFAEMEKKKRELEAKGKDIINLGIGDPDQPPPELVINKLVASLYDDGIHQYATTQGIDEFRYAVARWMEKRYNVKLDPQKEVLHGIGSKEVIAHLPLALTEPGDVILIPEPGYPPYRSGTIFALAEPYAMPLKRENNFLPDLSSIPEDIAKKAKVIFVNYPNNPTGATATKDFYKRLVAFANKYNIIVVSDAAYAELYYEEKPISFLEIDGAKDVGIEVHSMTKTFSMAGWRMAWACGNSQILETLRGLKANLDSGQFMALQKAATAGLTTGESEMSAI
ncbi:MAG: LL-diaminopimelate aminotransferase, partial [Planctomycetes bacterium RBG_16_43_13]